MRSRKVWPLSPLLLSTRSSYLTGGGGGRDYIDALANQVFTPRIALGLITVIIAWGIYVVCVMLGRLILFFYWLNRSLY